MSVVILVFHFSFFNALYEYDLYDAEHTTYSY